MIYMRELRDVYHNINTILYMVVKFTYCRFSETVILQDSTPIGFKIVLIRFITFIEEEKTRAFVYVFFFF